MVLPSGCLIVAWRQLLCLDLLVSWWSILGQDWKGLKCLADNGFHVGADRERSGQGHHQELLLHVAPAGEDEHVGKEEEDVTPLDVMAPEVLDHVHGEEADDKEEEEEPWEEEAPAPGAKAMASKKVADRGDRGKEAEEAAVDDHPIPLLHLVGQGHCDEGNPRDEVANVKEEEKSEEGLGGPVDAGRLLVGPDCPEGGCEVPHCLHRDRGPLHLGWVVCKMAPLLVKVA